MREAAQIISRVFDPMLEIPAAIGLAILLTVREGIRWRFLGLILFIDLVVPLVFFAIMLLKGQIKDWDVRERRERIPLYFFTMVCHLAGVWLAFALGKVELSRLLLVFWLSGVLFAGVTIFWKISLHGGVNALLITLLNYFFDWRYLYLYLILVVVGWARVKGGHHTPLQYAAGVTLGIASVLAGQQFVG